MDALAEKLDARLREWKPETAAEVRERIAEVIDLADHDVLDLARSRAAEQEVLYLLDEPPSDEAVASAGKSPFGAMRGEFELPEGWDRPLTPEEAEAFWDGKW